MDDTKVYDQTLKKLQSHLPFLSDFISKIKAKSQAQQGNFLSKLEKLSQHANHKQLKLEFMIKIEKSIMNLKEKYESKIVDTSMKETSIQTTELIKNEAIKVDDFTHEESVLELVTSDSPSPSRHFDRMSSIEIPKLDKYRNDRHSSHNKNDWCNGGKRPSFRYDQHERSKSRDRFKYDRLDSSEKPVESDRYRYEHKRGSRMENRVNISGSSKNETVDVKSTSDFETEIKCERSPVGRQNSKLVVNSISSNSALERFGTRIAKVSSEERLTEEDVSKLRARHSQMFGCDSDSVDDRKLSNLKDLRAKLLTLIAESKKWNEQRATSSDLPTSELSRISFPPPIPKTGLKIKLDLLKQREASKECTSALSTESGKKDSSKFSFTETFNRTSKSSTKYPITSAEPLGFTCVDEDIITKIPTQPINEKNVTSLTSKDVTIAQNIPDPWILDVVKQALDVEEESSNAAEVAANTHEKNSWSDSERLAYKHNREVRAYQHSSDKITEIQNQTEDPLSNNLVGGYSPRLWSRRDARVQLKQDYPPPAVPSLQESYNMNGLDKHPGQQHTFPSTSQSRIQTRPNLIQNYNNQLPPPDVSPHNGGSPINCEYRPLLINIDRQTHEQSCSVNSRLSLDSQNNKAPMTYGEYKRSQQTAEKLCIENVTSASNTDISKSHLDNLLVSGSKSDFGQKFLIPKKRDNSAAKSNEIQSESNFRNIRDLAGPNLSVAGSKSDSDISFKIPKNKLNDAAKSIYNNSDEQPNFKEVRDLDDSESEGVLNCDNKASESRDPPIVVNAVKKKSAVHGKNMKGSPSTELPNDVVTNSMLFLADNQLTATQEDVESMLQQFMNPKNLLAFITVCAERSNDQIFSEIKQIIQRSDAINPSPSIEERTDGPSTSVETRKFFRKTSSRKKELCPVYDKANKKAVAALQNLNIEKQQHLSNPLKEAQSLVRRKKMTDYTYRARRYTPPPIGRNKNKSQRSVLHLQKVTKPKRTKTVDDVMNESPRVTPSRLTKKCTVVLEKLHPRAIVKKLTSIVRPIKNEGEKRRIKEIDRAENIETGKKKLLSSHTFVVKNNNPEWHCLKKGMECQLCGKAVVNSLVSHYVNSHPNKEVFPCRVAPDVADFLRNSREEHKVECIASFDRFKQRCYFCNEMKCLLKTSWIEHTAVHTGYTKDALSQLNENEIFGYLCDLCNFVRFDENEIAKHLCCEHESIETTKYKKVVFLRFPTKNVQCKIESNTVEQIVENISRKRSKRESNMDNDNTELEENSPEKVRKKNEGTEGDKTESLEQLILDEDIPIFIQTQTDDDNLMEQNTAEDTPREKTSPMRPSVRENNCTAPGTLPPLDYIIVEEEEENRGPIKSEILSISLSDNEDCETKVFTHVYNIGYTKSFDIMENRIKFFCFIDLCGFETMHLDSLLSHIEDHSVEWVGFCFTCNAQIFNNQVPLMMEFKHMTEAHLNKIDGSDCGEQSGERNHFVKCIELSKLQDPKHAARAKDAAPSSSLVCENDTEEIVLKQWIRNPTSKLQTYCKIMMCEISLFALFKCMDVKCCFTTNNAEVMLNHLQNHETRALSQINPMDVQTSSWLECAYCDKIGRSTLLLVKHIQEEHQSSIFQCSYCFYRSVAAYNVIVHLSQFHRSKEKFVLVCNGKTKGYATEKALIERSRKEFVRPLRCAEGCKKSTFVMDYFVQHMKSSPFHSNLFTCQICGFNILITEAVRHLACHRIGILECIYCQCGTNDIATIRKHMCNSHPSKLPYICVRLTRKSQILTDEQLSSVESTLLLDIGQPVDAKIFQRCPYSEEQLNYLSPSIDINSNISAAMGRAPIAYIQPSTSFFVPTDIETNAAGSMSNQTFSNAETLGLTSEGESRQILSDILSYEDLEKEYISDDYDKYFHNIFGSLQLSEQPSTSNQKQKASAIPLVVELPENKTKSSTSPMSSTDLLQDVIDVDACDLDFDSF